LPLIGISVTRHALFVTTPPSKPSKIIGWIWILLSPILMLMGLLSTVESERTYTILLVGFGLATSVGLIGGVGFLLEAPWSRLVLRAVSWIGCAYFGGSGLTMLAYTAGGVLRGEIEDLVLVVLVSVSVVAMGLPFLLMALRLKPYNRT
jgi:hypothetical protein